MDRRTCDRDRPGPGGPVPRRTGVPSQARSTPGSLSPSPACRQPRLGRVGASPSPPAALSRAAPEPGVLKWIAHCDKSRSPWLIWRTRGAGPALGAKSSGRIRIWRVMHGPGTTARAWRPLTPPRCPSLSRSHRPQRTVLATSHTDPGRRPGHHRLPRIKRDAAPRASGYREPPPPPGDRTAASESG
jgi:hypothetical protein